MDRQVAGPSIPLIPTNLSCAYLLRGSKIHLTIFAGAVYLRALAGVTRHAAPS